MPTYFIPREPITSSDFELPEKPSLISPHPTAISPIDGRTLWRYMDLAAYIWLLSRAQLYMQRADLFASMDPMELSWGLPNVAAHAGTDYAQEAARVRASLRDSIGKYYVNCWHMNELESAAMWSIYGKSQQGIAITSTLSAMAAQFSTRDPMDADHWRIALVGVEYIDHQTTAVQEDNAMRLLGTKSISYGYENEVRLALIPPVQKDFSAVDGVSLPIDLGTLLTGVYIHPQAPPWFRSAAQSVSLKFGIPEQLLKSSALAKPIL
jgi:hypothetical protein